MLTKKMSHTLLPQAKMGLLLNPIVLTGIKE
jgi:hypothetical protein